MIGGLAAACLNKAFGIVFPGEPRHDQARHGLEVGWAMGAPMGVLALGCVAVGFLAPQAVAALKSVIRSVTGLGESEPEGPGNIHRRPLSGMEKLLHRRSQPNCG